MKVTYFDSLENAYFMVYISLLCIQFWNFSICCPDFKMATDDNKNTFYRKIVPFIWF